MSETDFITQCFQRGIKKIPDICIEINKEIQKIENNLLEIENKKRELNQQKRSFHLLANELNISTNESVLLDPKVNFDKLSPYIQDTISKIINLIKQNQESPLTSREIVEKISLKENKAVLCSLKWLWDNRIIERNSNLAFIKGVLWEQIERITINVK